MFFLGQLNGTQTASGGISTVQADLIGLLTGQITNIEQLSSIWNKDSSKMTVNTVPGWVLHDDAAGAASTSTGMNYGTIPKVVRAPWSDDSTKSKYLNIAAGDNSNSIRFLGYEAWNNVTHVGVNPQGTSASSSWHHSVFPTGSNTGTKGWIMVSASANHFLFAHFKQDGLIGLASDYFFLSEFSREDEWNTVENGMPAWFTSGSCGMGTYAVSATNITVTNTNGALSRWLDSNNATADVPIETISPLFYAAAGPTYNRIAITAPNRSLQYHGNFVCGLENFAFWNPYAARDYFNENRKFTYALTPMRLTCMGVSTTIYGIGVHQFGSITAKNPFVYGFKNVFNSGDEFYVGNDLYFVFNFSGSYIAVKES